MNPAQYHTSCQTLMFDTFIRIDLEGDLTPLIISGEPTQEELSSAWEEILAEFSGLIQTTKSKAIFDSWKRFIDAEYRIKTAEVIIFVLKRSYDEALAKALLEFGFDYIPNSDPQNIKKLENEIGSQKILRDQLRGEYEKIAGGSTMSDEPQRKKTMADYDTDLAALSKFMGYRIDKKVTTVAEYASILNLFSEYQEKNRKQ